MNPDTKASRRTAVSQYYDDLEVVDDYTVRIVLKSPNTFGPSVVGGQPMFPPKYAQTAGAETFSKQPVGTGPYKFVERKPGEVITLEANESYWDKDPDRGPTPSQFRTVRQRIIPEDQARLAAMQTNEVAFIVNVPEASIKRLESMNNVKLQYREFQSQNYMMLNSGAETDSKTGKPNPLQDVRVPQAINYAVDIDTIIKKLRTEKEHRSNGAPAGTVYFDPNRKPYPYDPAKAKSLLAESGYSSGLDMTIYDPTGRWPQSKKVNEAIAGCLTAVGLKTTVQPMEYAAVATGLDEKKLYPMAFWGLPMSGDGSGSTTTIFRKSPNSRRSIYVGNAKVEALADQVFKEFDTEKQAAIFRELNKAYFEDAGELFLYDQWFVFAYNINSMSWDENGPRYSGTSGNVPYWEFRPVRR